MLKMLQTLAGIGAEYLALVIYGLDEEQERIGHK